MLSENLYDLEDHCISLAGVLVAADILGMVLADDVWHDDVELLPNDFLALITKEEKERVIDIDDIAELCVFN